ncbi:hypothetical protein RB653_001605 [Dictyostelium firmibasis]|uniref:Uncharacterized protein n=1 Tax=Dictyostelium firmibasis TaxID=79012 RepID=A0AAN7YRI6_9MYCE
MIRSAISKPITQNNLQALLVTNFTQPILFRNNFTDLSPIDFKVVDNRPNPKQKYIDIKDTFSIKPKEISQDDLIINEDTLKTGKNRIIAMPYQFNYTNFYKGKKSTKKGVTKKKKHLRDFGVVPNIFPESMFRDYYMKPIPLSKVQEGNIDN